MRCQLLAFSVAAACGDSSSVVPPPAMPPSDKPITPITQVDTTPEIPAEPERCDVLSAVVRDFRGYDEQPPGHPDFQNNGGEAGVKKGLVTTTLSEDNKPHYSDSETNGPPTARQISSSATFDQWYRDIEGVNQRFVIELPLQAGIYNNADFFPLDGRGYGDRPDNPGSSVRHNFHFTTEIHTNFVYQRGKNLVFDFFGDDDLWIFVHGKLALDLGGIHPAAAGTIDFNQQAEALGLVDGERYAMDIFHAERHTDKSGFRIQTNIPCFISNVLQ